jgi:hypothetical protein
MKNNKIDWDKHCYHCTYREECEKEFGKIGVDKEDCRQISGTYYCTEQWLNDECGKCGDE